MPKILERFVTKLTQERFVSRLTPKTLALVLAGGRGARLEALTDWRTKPAVPFGGKFRIIDFTLSNCLNSGIRKICVLTQYKSHSLIQHIMKAWAHLNTEQNNFLDIVPAQQWTDDETWYQGTADAVFQTLDIIESHVPEYVLVLAGDHIYSMDYGEMLAEHVQSNADFTIACNAMPVKDASNFGVMQIDRSGRVIGFEEKPDAPKPIPKNTDNSLVSMGIYVFSLDYLRRQLRRDAKHESSSHDFGKDVIPHALAEGDNIHAYQFRDPRHHGVQYWRDVGTVDAYFQANLEIVSPNPPIDIYDEEWPITTYQPQLPPAHFVESKSRCDISNTMVSGGCVIESSRLHNTILFSNVKIRAGCEFEGVLALPGCEIGVGSKLKNVILDNQCIVPDGTVIDMAAREGTEKFFVTEGGVVIVNREMLGQGSHYMPGLAGNGFSSKD